MLFPTKPIHVIVFLRCISTFLGQKVAKFNHNYSLPVKGSRAKICTLINKMVCICIRLAVCFFPRVFRLPTASAIPQHCYEGNGLESVVCADALKSCPRGSDLAQQHNALDQRHENEFPCKNVRGKYTVVRYSYRSILVDPFLATIDSQPGSNYMDHSNKDGFPKAHPEADINVSANNPQADESLNDGLEARCLV